MTDTRDTIAARHNVPEHLLRGTTPAELETHAAELAAAGYSSTDNLTPAELVDRALGLTNDTDQIINAALGR